MTNLQSKTFVINVHGLNKSFNGKPAVVDVKLQVRGGEIFGFLGPNGSGKTTTIRMLCGLLTPDSGTGTCLDYDVLTESHKIKNHVGYMTQKFSLYDDLTVEENLDFTGRLYQVKNRKNAIQMLMEEMNFTQRRGQLAGTLSGGWKQRLALAAALLHNPDLLLLDEPTAGVDPKARRDFWDQVHRLAAKGITTLVSTHYMDEAERCTRLAYIAHGHIRAEGTAEEIIHQSNLSTWRIKGGDPIELTTLLNQLPGVEQVAAFGTALHASGTDSAALRKSVESIRSSTIICEPIEPNLEDVFISLV